MNVFCDGKDTSDRFNYIELGNSNWINGYENYIELFMHLKDYFDKQSLEILNNVMQRKMLARNTQEKKTIAKLAERKCFQETEEKFQNVLYPIGVTYLKNNTKLDIYVYEDILIPMRIKNCYTFINNCFLDDIFKEYMLNKNGIDIGAGAGLSSIFLAKQMKKLYAIEPSIYAFDILNKSIELNNINNVVCCNCCIGDDNSSVYISNNKNQNNITHKEKVNNSLIGIQQYTLENFIKDNDIANLGFINIWTGCNELQILVKSKEIINNFRPIVQVNIERSADLMFKVIMFCINNYKNYNFSLRKTHEQHVSNGLFLQCYPKELC